MTSIEPTFVTTAPVLLAEDLSVTFHVRRGVMGKVPLHAVSSIDFEIDKSETLGLVGESGSGKSTTGRAVLRLLEPSGGHVYLNGDEITDLSRRKLRPYRRRMQMIFQDPYSSLDPSVEVWRNVGEPLEVHRGLRGRALADQVAELFDHVGLARHHMHRYPYEFSGGQRQRLAIARAIALNPDLIVCDEAVSALDVSTRNQITNLLEDIQDEFGVSYLFIAHDLGVVRHMSHRVAVMYLGRIVEDGPTARLYDAPAHPYTEALLSAVPIADPLIQRTRERIVLPGDVPDATNPPPGCPFNTRCAYVMDICREVMPEPTPVAGGGMVRCHLHTTGPTLAGGSVLDVERPRTKATKAVSHALR